LKIVWDEEIARSVPGAHLSIVANDIDRTMLDRARRGCFAPTSLGELPQHFVHQAFDREGALYCIRPRYREGLEFLHQDLRREALRAFLLERGIAVRQGQRFLRAELPRLLATPADVLSPRMIRNIEDLANDWRRLDQRIEGLSEEIDCPMSRSPILRRLFNDRC
jgi:hypothetical protein